VARFRESRSYPHPPPEKKKMDIAVMDIWQGVVGCWGVGWGWGGGGKIAEFDGDACESQNARQSWLSIP